MQLKSERNLRSLTIASLLFIAAFCSIQKASGQAAIIALLVGDKVASENFNLSMELGGNFSQFSNLQNTKGRPLAINFGIAGNLLLSKNWFLSPTIYFLSRRKLDLSSLSLNSGNLNLDKEFMDKPAQIKVGYIDIPIFLFFQTNSKKFRFGMAPQVSFLVGSEAVITGDQGDFKQNFESFTNDMDYGLLGDFAYILGKAHQGKGIHLHLRYYYGLADVFTSDFSSDDNLASYFSFHISLPFITDELAAKNLAE